MKGILRLIIIQVMFSTVSYFAFGQSITMEQTLTYINNKFGGACRIEVERGILIAKYYDGATIYREDQVFCKSLNINSMSYDKEHRLFSIDCTGASKCVDRQLFVRKIQRDYARISFPVTLDSKSESGMKNAFTHMIKLVLDTKYNSSDPFE